MRVGKKENSIFSDLLQNVVRLLSRLAITYNNMWLYEINADLTVKARTPFHRPICIYLGTLFFKRKQSDEVISGGDRDASSWSCKVIFLGRRVNIFVWSLKNICLSPQQMMQEISRPLSKKNWRRVYILITSDPPAFSRIADSGVTKM